MCTPGYSKVIVTTPWSGMVQTRDGFERGKCEITLLYNRVGEKINELSGIPVV